MYKKHKVIAALTLLCCFLALFFRFLFVYDNKYNTPPPYGQDGVLQLSEEDFTREKPLYLIDGWLLTDQTAQRQQTYIGEFSNLQRGDRTKSPHGKAVYELTLRYTGNPRIVVIDFPELFSAFHLSWNGQPIAQGTGSARVLVELRQGDQLLCVETLSHTGYYSGMYFPAALGDDSVILRVERTKTLFYAVCTFCTLILLSFTFQLWRRSEGNRTVLWLGALCSCFAAYVGYYFVQLFSPYWAPLWYYMEDVALYGLVFCMIQLTGAITGLRGGVSGKAAVCGAVTLPAVLLVLHGIIPYWTPAIWLHGRIKILYILLTFLWLLTACILCISRKRSEYPYIVAGNLIFGTGLLLNLFQSNLFEPIYSLWQFEWCGLLLIWLFATMMVARNRRILRENKDLTLHLEHLVEQRTEELSCVLQERRAFFSDMAHDLKAPILAIKTFIEVIRNHSVGVDEELRYYLDQVENKQSELSKRVQSLSTINSLDKMEGKKERLSLCGILEEVYATHYADAAVSAVHLITHAPKPDCFVFMQQDRLLMVFENLIYNALRATLANGSIIIGVKCVGDNVEITVDDTGCGISEAELPFVFKRFYVGEQNKASGSGLGLYIVKTVLEEAGGQASATSQVGRGSRFLLTLPRCP